MRRVLFLSALLASLALISPEVMAAPAKPVKTKAEADNRFAGYVERIWPLARARGVSRATFDLAFKGMTPDAEVIALTKKQSEFVKPIWDYLASATSAARIERGSRILSENESTLAAVEARYGVDRSVILGVWGMETNFGSYTGGKDVIRSLATLASIGYRGTYFRDELINALRILEDQHVSRADFKGSWAGAMGQTQFMPSSFWRFAVDFDGDGHKDVWKSVPDALASTANYLKENGWRAGQPWGFEVTLPKGFDYRLHDASFSEWSSYGVSRADGRALPQEGQASLFYPAGADGPIFLVTSNFGVIKRYNASDAYALGVASLGDLLNGGARIRASWPTEDPLLALAQRIELQRALTRLGYDVGDPDGRIGSRTRAAIRDFQQRAGLRPDGYPNRRVLEALQTR
ncbi:MAG: lytic murein transglycosylase [Alphaproteobacteria bacterium]